MGNEFKKSPISRRTAISGIVSTSFFLPSSVLSDTIVVPNNDLVPRNDIFAKLSRNGPYPQADRAVKISVNNNDVTLIIYVSKTVETSKLIVFSHAALANPEVYEPLLKFLTTHGYCVVCPVHRDSFYSGDVSFENERDAIEDIARWEKRVNECVVARDSYKIISDTLKIAVDATNPVIIGHSHGAFTAQLSSGVSVDTISGPMRFDASGWAGSILISAPGSGTLGLKDTSWRNCNIPMMTITSAADFDLIVQEKLQDMDSFYLSRGPYKHLVYLSEGESTIYSGQAARVGTREYYIFFDIRGSINIFLNSYAVRKQESLTALYDGSFQDKSYKFISILSK